MTAPTPRLVAWELTRACNLRCRHCRAGALAAPSPDELSLDEAKRVVDDIASFARPILILTGGEPLLCPHLFEIAAYARDKGLKPVVGTNATLIDDATAGRLAASGVSRISVSIDFPSAESHDAFRGVKGAFDAALSGVRAARRAGVGVQVNTTVTRLNLHLLEDIHALAVSLGAQAMHPFLLVPTGRGAGLSGEELSAQECEETLKWVYERQKTSPLELKPTDAPQYRRIAIQSGGCGMQGKGCLAGTGFCFIGSCGDVQPCGYFDMKLGNVRKTPFSRIWCESPVLDDLRHPERLKGKCGVCEYKSVCGGCRARAFAKTGDYMAEEPCCAHVPERRLVDLLQTSFPLVERPYAELGGIVGVSEKACYEKALDLRRSGILRRIGASFVPRRLGHVSTLVAAKVADKLLDEVAAAVGVHAEVTHSYSRSGDFNLWFTLVAESANRVAALLSEISQLPGVLHVMDLPAYKTYKLRAVFCSHPAATDGAKEESGDSAEPPAAAIRDFVLKMQGDILDVGLAPFAPGELGLCRRLTANGTIRRFGAFVNHRAVGFSANALAAWSVPPESLDTAGAALAASPAVSHCYAREVREGWPYNLYAMVHARSREVLAGLCRELSGRVETAAGAAVPSRTMTTMNEYKKSPALYFKGKAEE